MKFLCVPCDQPMQLDETSRADGGSISLVYSCPACGYEFAMLTNAHETQVVGSLGVKLGGASAASASKCPFTGVVRELNAEAAGADAGDTSTVAWTPGAEARLAGMPDFVRPMVKAGLERYAVANGRERIDEGLIDEVGRRMVTAPPEEHA